VSLKRFRGLGVDSLLFTFLILFVWETNTQKKTATNKQDKINKQTHE